MVTYEIPGVTQHSVEVHGIRMAYLQAGSGPPVVLLHGLASSSLTWSANIQALARHFTVYALDAPGHGGSAAPKVGPGVEAGVQVLRGFLESIGQQRVTLVGNSLGGLVALRFALDYPDQVTHLVLVDSAGLGQRIPWRLRLISLPLLGRLLLHPKTISVKRFAKRLFHDPERVDRRLIHALHHARTVQLANHLMVSMARTSVGLTGLKRHNYFLPRLGELRPPLLVVWGERDRVLPVAHAYEVARRYPGIQLEVFPECGHWPHLEQADAFNHLVLRFLGAGTTP